MRFFSRFARGNEPLNRIEAFSDGVFAIVVTLLVLDLKVPALAVKASSGELGHGLVALLPSLLSWLISFIIVCKFWINHHAVIGLASHANYALMWLNALFLMGQSFIPFPTALMGEYHANALAVSLFGVVMALNTLLFMLLHRYILHHLLKDDRVGTQDPRIIAKSFIGVGSYLLGAAAAWGNIYAAFFFYMLTPFFFIVPTHYEAPKRRVGF
jgi:uncharacterized membrane protein